MPPSGSSSTRCRATARRSAARSPPTRGPTWWNWCAPVRLGGRRWPSKPVDRLTNTVEFFVHHEDVRRAQDGWSARPVDGDLEHELWRRLKPAAKVLARRSPVGLVLRRSNGDEIVAKKPADGAPVVVVTGPASELVLFAYGRQRHANVDITADADVAAPERPPSALSAPAWPSAAGDAVIRVTPGRGQRRRCQVRGDAIRARGARARARSARASATPSSGEGISDRTHAA